MKKLLVFYLCFGAIVCVWYSVAAAKGWRAVNLDIVDGSSSSSGRGFGGSWGGGK